MSDASALAALLRGRTVVALTGAGCSTDSGIPDYRGPDGVQRRRPPVQYAEFVKSAERRQRYWARSVAGWGRFSSATPGASLRALVALEEAGALRGIITQNVDRLHHAAGSRRVVELHGALARVRCMACGAFEARDALQARLLALNPDYVRDASALAPDGDSEIDDERVARFLRIRRRVELEREALLDQRRHRRRADRRRSDRAVQRLHEGHCLGLASPVR